MSTTCNLKGQIKIQGASYNVPSILWNGLGSDNNWSTPNNWDLLIPPPTYNILHFSGNTRTTPINNTPVGTSINSIYFDSGAASFTISGNNFVLNSTPFRQNSIRNDSINTQNINNNIQLAEGIKSINCNTGNITINGVVGGTGTLLKTGTGLLALTASNTYTGGTYVSGGIVVLSSPNSLGSNRNVTMENNTTLRAGVLNTLYYPKITPSSSITLNSTSVGGSSPTTAFGLSGIEGDQSTIVNTTGNQIWFQGDCTKFFGTLAINSFFVYLGNTNGDLSNASVNFLFTNRSLQGSGIGTTYNLRIGALSSVGTAATANVGGTYSGTNDCSVLVGYLNTSTNFAGFIANARSGGVTRFTKVGTGTFTIQGINTYQGTTTINGGTFEIGGAGQLQLGGYANTISIASGCVFSYNSTANQALSGVISGLGSLIKNNTGTLTLNAANTYTGFTAISAGTLTTTVLPSNPSNKISFASFTNTALTVNFAIAPISGETYKLLSGNTINTYPSGNIILQNASATASYNSSTSILTIN